MLYAMTFSNTAKSGNVLASNVTRREAEIKNSNGKQSVFQLLNFMLIIYIRYCCSVHPSESLTLYLGKQIILRLPTTGLWNFFPTAYGVMSYYHGPDIGPKGQVLCEIKVLRGRAQN